MCRTTGPQPDPLTEDILRCSGDAARWPGELPGHEGLFGSYPTEEQGSITQTRDIGGAKTRYFWQKGFGQTLTWRGRSLQYGMTIDSVGGSYAGSSSQRIGVRLPQHPGSTGIRASIEGRPVPAEQVDGLAFIALPASQREGSCRFKIVRY